MAFLLSDVTGNVPVPNRVYARARTIRVGRNRANSSVDRPRSPPDPMAVNPVWRPPVRYVRRGGLEYRGLCNSCNDKMKKRNPTRRVLLSAPGRFGFFFFFCVGWRLHNKRGFSTRSDANHCDIDGLERGRGSRVARPTVETRRTRRIRAGPEGAAGRYGSAARGSVSRCETGREANPSRHFVRGAIGSTTRVNATLIAFLR